jgi:hypothetical protein
VPEMYDHAIPSSSVMQNLCFWVNQHSRHHSCHSQTSGSTS